MSQTKALNKLSPCFKHVWLTLEKRSCPSLSTGTTDDCKALCRFQVAPPWVSYGPIRITTIRRFGNSSISSSFTPHSTGKYMEYGSSTVPSHFPNKRRVTLVTGDLSRTVPEKKGSGWQWSPNLMDYPKMVKSWLFKFSALNLRWNFAYTYSIYLSNRVAFPATACWKGTLDFDSINGSAAICDICT